MAELLELGAPPDLCDGYGVTPLVRSAMNGHVGTTGLLLVAGSDVNIIIKVCFQSAASREATKVVERHGTAAERGYNIL